MSYLADAVRVRASGGRAEVCRARAISRSVRIRSRPRLYGAADRYLGRLYSTLGQHDAALAAFEAALELDERAGWSTWIAHSQLRSPTISPPWLAAPTRASKGVGGQCRRHRRIVGDVRALATSRCAAPHLAPHPRYRRRPTRRESEVLHLLCQGKSNRQIGEEFTPVSTIANHVRATLAKTGASNRTEAATWAHHHGAFDPSAATPRCVRSRTLPW